MGKKYDINFPLLISNFIRPSKRKPKRIAWIYRLLKHIRTLHSLFLSFNVTTDDDLQYAPGYKMQIERMLNDRFGEGITITNNLQTVRPFFAFDTDDSRNQFAFDTDDPRNFYAHNTDAYNFNHVNFTVRVPALLYADLDRMNSMINRFNTRGMTFEIIEI